MITTLPIRFAMSALLFAAVSIASLTGCTNTTAQRVDSNTPITQISTTQIPMIRSPAVQAVVGDYVSADYDKRKEGYDWVGVMVKANGNEAIDIKVRSRKDIKKPSCHYDGTATFMGQDDAHGIIFQTIANDSSTFLQFKDGKLTIDAQDKYALNYFCSGGATLAGDYQKLAGKLALN